MSDILKKHKSIAIIIIVAALIAAAVFAVAVYRGRSDNPYVKTEEYLEIEDSVYISDILEGSEILDPLLPAKYTESEIYIYSEKIISEKRYTEITLETEYGSVMLIKYNYAYLYEDRAETFPDGTEKISENGLDIFIYPSDGEWNLHYYSDCILYTVTESTEAEIRTAAKTVVK